jgi:hypothetical protein
MPARDSDDPKIQFKAVGGLNERPAPHALEAPDFGVLHALYQRNYGALQRLEGTKTLALLPGLAGVLGGAQLDDGTGSVVVQGSNGTEYLYTLDELFGRSPVNTLVYEPLPDDNDMPTAILVQTATNGTDLATIGGAVANTWYTRPLTANPVNEDSIVVTFAANQFTIAAGTYRIRGWVTAAFTLNNSAGGVNPTSAEAGFQAAIVDITTGTTVAVGSPASVKLTRNSTAAFNAELGPVNVQSFIDYTFTIAGPGNSVMELQNAFSSTVVSNGVVTASGGVAANVSTVLNGAALAQPYAYLALAKVA